MEDDDAALAEVDQWIQTNNALMATGTGESKEALNQRIRTRLDTVRTNYPVFSGAIRIPRAAIWPTAVFSMTSAKRKRAGAI